MIVGLNIVAARCFFHLQIIAIGGDFDQQNLCKNNKKIFLKANIGEYQVLPDLNTLFLTSTLHSFGLPFPLLASLHRKWYIQYKAPRSCIEAFIHPFLHAAALYSDWIEIFWQAVWQADPQIWAKKTFLVQQNEKNGNFAFKAYNLQ